MNVCEQPKPNNIFLIAIHRHLKSKTDATDTIDSNLLIVCYWLLPICYVFLFSRCLEMWHNISDVMSYQIKIHPSYHTEDCCIYNIFCNFGYYHFNYYYHYLIFWISQCLLLLLFANLTKTLTYKSKQSIQAKKIFPNQHGKRPPKLTSHDIITNSKLNPFANNDNQAVVVFLCFKK